MLVDALLSKKDEFDDTWQTPCSLRADIISLMEEIPSLHQLAFKRMVLEGMQELLAVGKVFCVLNFNSGKTR